MQARLVVLAGSMVVIAAVGPARAQDTLASAKVSGYVQARETWRETEGLTASINRARLSVDGRLPNAITYRVSAEYASAPPPLQTGIVALRDAYARWKKAEWAITAGQFKTPFSREFLTSLTQLETLDRSAVVDTLATRRDVGVQVAYFPSATYELTAGAFNGEGQNVFLNRNQKSMLVGRALVRPVAGLTVAGNAATYAGDSVRFGADVSVESRGALGRGEFIGQHVRGRDRDESGWYLLAAYRVLPWLQLVARQEDFLRPHLGEARRTSASLGGVNVDLAGGRTRLAVEGEARRHGSPRQTQWGLKSQLQVVF